MLQKTHKIHRIYSPASLATKNHREIDSRHLRLHWNTHHSNDLEFYNSIMDENQVPNVTNERRNSLSQNNQSKSSKELIVPENESSTELRRVISKTSLPDIGIRRTSGNHSLSKENNLLPAHEEDSRNEENFTPHEVINLDSTKRSSWFLANVAQTYPDDVLISLFERIWLAMN